ncbi:Putative Polyprotein [Phytophthora palmivora]|uniref:Polyprotein n=1 Tax=Phytophthora palmivora TaxID=4796 RepID=A0A2P4YGZ4_9STRA|nr:Putative Polyprotein [Phytophthora palmivora]
MHTSMPPLPVVTRTDSRLIIVSLLVAGARRPLRALLDSGATNNFFRASCLSVLPDSVRVRNGPGEVEIKLADGKTRRVARREVSLPYTFDGFHSNDDFLVTEMNYAFDCILGIPWLARYQPQIDWLARSVKRPHDFDVSEVFTHLVVAPRDWPHVTVVDALLTGDDDEGRAREDARERQASAHPRSSRMKNVARFPHDNEAVEQRLPHAIEAGTLDKAGKVHFLSTDGDHLRFSIEFLRMIMRRSSRGSRTTMPRVVSSYHRVRPARSRTSSRA